MKHRITIPVIAATLLATLLSCQNNVKEKPMVNEMMGEYLYTGPVDESGLPNGFGEAVFITNGIPNGFTYKGPFEKGNFSGDRRAILTNDDGDTFVGTFKNNNFVKGKYTIAETGEYFIGTFSNGAPSIGTWFNKDGKIMEEVDESSKEPLYEDKSNEDSLSDEEKFKEMQKYA